MMMVVTGLSEADVPGLERRNAEPVAVVDPHRYENRKMKVMDSFERRIKKKKQQIINDHAHIVPNQEVNDHDPRVNPKNDPLAALDESHEEPRKALPETIRHHEVANPRRGP